MEANAIIDGYFFAPFKRSADLIAQHRGFFGALANIEQVIVLGHSLSDVDAAYFVALLERRSVAKAIWLIACHSPSDWPEKQSLPTHLGVNANGAFPIAWESLQVDRSPCFGR